MASIVYGGCIINMEGAIITIETQIHNRVNKFIVVGLGDTAVLEARERVRFGLINSQYRFPKRGISINLAPAQVRKSGCHLDLAIAVGILQATEQIRLNPDHKTIFIGELGLEGQIRPVHGVLALLQQAINQGFTHAYIPASNQLEASLVAGKITILPLEILAGIGQEITPLSPYQFINHKITYPDDFREIVGNIHAKRALLICAAGGHNILLQGPPGTGKSLLAKAMSSILPPLTYEELITITSIRSLSGEHIRIIDHQRPFRSPHHSSSANAIIGGGAIPTPGEITLAHRGVLFLDEFSEFRKDVLESLREPLEERVITISRAQAKARFPADFQLVAAMNPCPCGYSGDKEITCRCNMLIKSKYLSKLSGPILDRIDLFSYVPRLPPQQLWQTSRDESSSVLQACVVKAHQKQLSRQGKQNSALRLTLRNANEQLLVNTDAQNTLQNMKQVLQLSPRAWVRLLKVSRTIADLHDSTEVNADHCKEALNYRHTQI